VIDISSDNHSSTNVNYLIKCNENDLINATRARIRLLKPPWWEELDPSILKTDLILKDSGKLNYIEYSFFSTLASFDIVTIQIHLEKLISSLIVLNY